jgi:hypothetical protein
VNRPAKAPCLKRTVHPQTSCGPYRRVVSSELGKEQSNPSRGREARPQVGCLGRAEPVAQPATPRAKGAEPVAPFSLGEAER